VRAFWVSHAHWDREWYRTFQEFRARLVDAVDLLLDLCAADPDYRFLLDGQTVAVEDYLALRPHRAADLRGLIERERVAIGPWYVQPDSLLPAGESHVRNLLEGRRTGDAFGGASRIGYTPDSFGHPAQLPQILAGFGLRAFVYWRGHGDELAALPPEYDWQAPDGSAVLACHLRQGYFNAASDARSDAAETAAAIAKRALDLAPQTRSGAILLLNGFDHAPPEPRANELAQRVASATGFAVERALLEDFVAAVAESPEPRPVHRGELVGARAAPLLFGVWSTRTWIKLANRAAEAELLGWAEPWGALGTALGAVDERPALRAAWRELLANHAHDSICGCSRDEVHEQMRPRFDAARELARETARRSLERIAGLAPPRRMAFRDELELAVFNPSPHPRTDRVRYAIDPHPFMIPAARPQDVLHPAFLRDASEAGYEADGAPVRATPASEPGRLCLVPDRVPPDLELVVRDVPAFGWKRVRVRHTGRAPQREVAEVEPGSADAAIAASGVSIAARADGSVDAELGGRRYAGLLAVEDVGDRGDSYDFDPVGASDARVERVRVVRERHAAGIARLRIEREVSVPARLAPDRRSRSAERASLRLDTELTLAEGVPRVDIDVCLDNTARDHRLRLLFPLGEPVARFEVASTFDVATRAPGALPDAGWVQRAPATFVHLGWVHAAGLTVVAPGLSEAEVVPAPGGAVLALALVRAVGYLSRSDLTTRPMLAGPGTSVPGAQCLGPLRARLALFAGCDPAAALAAEWGLRAVEAGPAAEALWPEGRPLLEIAPRALLLSALKPAADGDGFVLRVLNPTPQPLDAEVTFGLPIAHASFARLDESPADGSPARSGSTLRFPVGPHALRSLHVVLTRAS
jgi:2-O-(6-phospho-alpha-D-mannosyl)-D-glycerate hydrolase